MQTDKNSVIGGYMSDQWEDTTGKKNSYDWSDCKDIVSGKPFLFYWVNGQIQIIKHSDDRIPLMGSDEDRLIVFGCGLSISVYQNENSIAYANDGYWVHPENTGNLTKIDDSLYFAGGNDHNFKCLDVEVWGLH